MALHDLVDGSSTRCLECYLPDRGRELGRASAAVRWPDGHGLSYHPLYSVWHGMMRRCYDPRSQRYSRYGGRQPYPITVCPRWHDVAAFVEDIEPLLGPRPEGFSLDRIRNGLGYKPSNVRWADDHTQLANRGKSWWEMTPAEQSAQCEKWKTEQLAARM